MKHLFFKYNLYRYNKSRLHNKYFCIAPFTSLFLDYKGNVYACFANKHMLLGNYLQESLLDIWNGKQANLLRENIVTLKLEHGCQVCKNKVFSGQFTQVFARRYDSLIINKTFLPSSLDLQLSNRCNLKCLMCVVSKDEKSSVDIEKVRENIRQMIPFLKNVSFSGGEPFMIHEYYNLWQDFIDLNPSCKISVNTNGTILNDRVKYFLQNLRFNICVSIDGLNQDTFEKIRLNASKEQVYQNLHYFREYCQKNDTFFNIKACILKQNIHEIPDLIQYFDALNVIVILNEVVYPLNTALWNFKSKRLKEIINVLLKGEKKFSFLNESNEDVYKGLISLLKNYYQNSLKFERYLNKKYSFEKIKSDVIKRLSIFFDNEVFLQKFMSLIEQYSSDKKILTTIYLFFLIAPFERMIGEIEVRNSNELKQIFDNILENFDWL